MSLPEICEVCAECEAMYVADDPASDFLIVCARCVGNRPHRPIVPLMSTPEES